MIPNSIKTTQQEVKNLELKLNLKLSKVYKQFLMDFNGGTPIHSALSFKIIPDGHEIGVHLAKMFSVSEMESYYNKSDIEDEGMIEIAEANGVIIGINDGGDAICLCVKGKDKGKIFHHNGDFGVLPIANSLDDFFNLLKLDGKI